MPTNNIILRANSGMIRDAWTEADKAVTGEPSAGDGPILAIRQTKFDGQGALDRNDSKVIRLTRDEVELLVKFWQGERTTRQ